jgi:outer membrane protein, heavy metal efflux system
VGTKDIKKLSFVFYPLLALGGCASVNPRASLPDVERLVAERGIEKVHWRGDVTADTAVDAHIRELLTENLTQDKAIQIALLNNRTLQSTFEELGVAQADLVAAGLLNNPVLDAEIRFFKGSANPTAEFGLIQNFLDIFFIPLRKRIAEAAIEGTKLRVAGAIIDLAAQVRVAFYEHQAAVQSLDMRQQVLKATEASYALSRNLRAAGNITELDLLNERALYEQSKLSVRSTELSVLRSRERLNILMGLWGQQTGWTIIGRLPDPPTKKPEADGLEKRAVERSLDLGAARQDLQSAAKAVGIARPLALFPDSAFGASGEHETSGDWGFGPAFSLPLTIFHQGQPGTEAARAALRSASEKYVALAVGLRSQVRTAYAALLGAYDEAKYYDEVLLPLRQRIVDQTLLQYNAMQIGANQLLQAKQQHIDAGDGYIQALRAYWIARTEMDQLLNGRMTEFKEMAASPEDTGSPSIGPQKGHER